MKEFPFQFYKTLQNVVKTLQNVKDSIATRHVFLRLKLEELEVLERKKKKEKEKKKKKKKKQMACDKSKQAESRLGLEEGV